MLQDNEYRGCGSWEYGKNMYLMENNIIKYNHSILNGMENTLVKKKVVSAEYV